MSKDLKKLSSMINGTSDAEMKKWAYELGEPVEPITLCDVRREVESKTGAKYSTGDILDSIKDAGGVVVPRDEDGRYDLTYVDVKKVVEEIKDKTKI